MRLIASPEEAAAGETVLIRSHGESREVLEELQARGAEIVSATCPNVRHIQILVTEAETAGRQVVIIGEHDHPPRCRASQAGAGTQGSSETPKKLRNGRRKRRKLPICP